MLVAHVFDADELNVLEFREAKLRRRGCILDRLGKEFNVKVCCVLHVRDSV
jgi:hypothetical protein